ncbi:hypothetical protein [Chitinophaga qingshengii]|uniref:DUF4595 domain-containing protein n=1 Tax=Chitinophaga qingshengii TaxID=1569794 RepID=A0ABR7TPH5_9BACT|nr:hypothetical protein [Chitinophaga qingshengii]MBC9930924.1 hypothetical protein [Chitinophaga qingshengii]
MKLYYTAICLMILVLTACRKKDNVGPTDPDYRNFSIASITDVPPFVYNGNQLVAIGNEQFSYDGKGRIIGSRMEGQDTILGLIRRYVYKTTFKWVNNLCAGSVADSLYNYTADMDGKVINKNFSSGDILSSYDYNPSSGQLNGLTLLPGKWTSAPYTSLKYEYDAKGNISRVECTQPSSIIGPGTGPGIDVYTITFEYDNHPNPFYTMYKKYGMILPALQQFATQMTPNNPVKMQLKVDPQLELTLTFSYEYNEAGYPVKIISNGGDGKVTYITYR